VLFLGCLLAIALSATAITTLDESQDIDEVLTFSERRPGRTARASLA
jgi:hypothetical protein